MKLTTIIIIMLAFILLISPVNAWESVYFKTTENQWFIASTQNASNFNIMNLGYNEVYIPYETNKISFTYVCPDFADVVISDQNMNVHYQWGYTLLSHPFERYTTFSIWPNPSGYNLTGTVYLWGITSGSFEYGLDPTYFTNYYQEPVAPPEVPFTFNNTTKARPDVNTMNISAFTAKYGGFVSDRTQLATIANYLLNRSVATNKEWVILLHEPEPFNYDTHDYYAGELKSFTYNTYERNSTIIHSHISSDSEHRLSEDDYYLGFYNNPYAYRMIEVDLTGNGHPGGVSIYQKGSAKEDRYIWGSS